MHADHIFGLPGLLLTLQIVAKAPPPKKKSGRGDPQRRKVVQVYGPVGLYNFIAMSLSLSATVLKHLTVEVFELQGGSSATRWRHPGAIRNYGEFRHPGLWRRSIPQNDDGTWTIEVAEEIVTAEDALRVDIERRGMYVTAAELDHVPKLQCFGYVVREATTQPRSIDKDRAIAAGVRPSKKFRILKSGIPVRSDDDTRLVDPKEVLLEDAPRLPRTLALLGDCCTVPEPMRKLCQDVDVLVHEATIGSDQDSGIKVDRGGHSTPSMAGKFANDVNAKVLILNHLSPHLRVRASERALAREAEEQIRGRTRVQVAYDYLELLVPPSGFPW
jgi:ribonuclease Z